MTLEGKVLVVVDMQPDYVVSRDETLLQNVERLIRLAINAESPVIFLEFGGPTHPHLLKCIQRYDMFAIRSKERCDGSIQVLDACNSGQYDLDAFVLCGVETMACVRDTAHGIAQQLPDARIEVVKNACNRVSRKSWACFSQAENIKVVRMRGDTIA